MTPEQYKLARQEKLIDQIAKERLAELAQKLKAAQERGDKKQVSRIMDLIRTNQSLLNLTGA